MNNVLKRFTTAIFTGIMLFAVAAFGFVGCGNVESKSADELQAELTERSEAIKEYFDGQVISLEQAYKFKLISYGDLLSVAYYHNGGNEYNEKVMPKDFVPTGKNSEEMDEQAKSELESGYRNKVYAGCSLSEYEKYANDEQFRELINETFNVDISTYEGYLEYCYLLSGAGIWDYYGTYNGCVVYEGYDSMRGQYGLYSKTYFTEIDGVTFAFEHARDRYISVLVKK